MRPYSSIAHCIRGTCRAGPFIEERTKEKQKKKEESPSKILIPSSTNWFQILMLFSSPGFLSGQLKFFRAREAKTYFLQVGTEERKKVELRPVAKEISYSSLYPLHNGLAAVSSPASLSPLPSKRKLVFLKALLTIVLSSLKMIPPIIIAKIFYKIKFQRLPRLLQPVFNRQLNYFVTSIIKTCSCSSITKNKLRK